MLIGLLGPVVVCGDEEQTQALGHRVRGVLAALTLHAGQKISQEQLAGFVWDEIPYGAASNIRSYVSCLRKIFARTGLVGDTLTSYRRGGTGGGGGYRLNISRDKVDIFLFQRLLSQGQAALATGDLEDAEAKLSTALALWRGFAGGPDVAGARGLLNWLDSHNGLRVAASEDLTETRLRLGRHSTLIPDIRAVLAHHPYRERSWGQLARACYFAGDLIGALNALNQARHTLASDLGVEPGPELQAIQSAILNRDEHTLRYLPSGRVTASLAK